MINRIVPLLTSLDLTYFDVLVISSFYQFCLYVMARLSHGGFTLGELGLVAHGATALFMETTNLTIALVRTLAFEKISASSLASRSGLT